MRDTPEIALWTKDASKKNRQKQTEKLSHFCASWKIKTTDNINKEVPFYVSGKCYREKEKKKGLEF